MSSRTIPQLPVAEGTRVGPDSGAGLRLLRRARSQAKWKDALRRRMLALADVAALAAGACAAGAVEPSGAGTTLWALALMPVWILLAKGRGLYGQDHVRIRHETIDEIVGLLEWVALSVAATALALAVLPGDLLSAGGAAVMGATAFLAVCLLRAAARTAWRKLVPPERGLLVGAGAVADAVARKLTLEPGHHLSLAMRVRLRDDRGADGNGRPVNGASGRGAGHSRWTREVGPDRLEELIRDGDIERVVIAVQDLDEQLLARVVGACRSAGVKVSVAPPLRAMLGTAVELNHLAELPLIEFRTWDPSRSTMLLKRTMDVALAGLALVLLAPLLGAIALAIRLNSRGPALFRQLRAGQDGRPFEMLKFRTMVHGAETQVGDVLDLEALTEPVFKLRHDPRVTRVGRLLRRTSLDELPQLVNVLRGHMSLVGPRPEETWLVERYDETERFRLEMRPGLTGAMQVHGRGELTFQERLAVEREYVENYSLRKDLQILLRTAAAVLRGRGAF